MDMEEYLENATLEQLKKFIKEEEKTLSSMDEEVKKEWEDRLYQTICGNHFNKARYKEAVEGMNHGDGRDGEHWEVDEITKYAKNHGASYKNYNEYDFAYVMNMVYMDYYGAIPDTTESYFRVAKAFIEDKDAPEGKAYIYWKAMSY